MAKKKPVPQKSAKVAGQILALQRPVQQPVADNPVVHEVLSKPDQPSLKPNEIADFEETDLIAESKPDPLVGTFVEVVAPWGDKVMVEITGVCLATDGAKWVSFNAIDEIPDGWSWRGGVKRIGATVA